MDIESFLLVGAIIFFIGLFGALTKRNAIVVLMCIELMFNGVNITAVAISRFVLPAAIADGTGGALTDAAQLVLTGQVFSVFIITIAAAEVALGLAIVISLFRNRDTIFVSDANELKH
jgi:NADH-quinone oxidoreductase subunit K